MPVLGVLLNLLASASCAGLCLAPTTPTERALEADHELSALSCSVVESKLGAGGTLVVVEVRNGSSKPAEPLTFELVTKSKKKGVASSTFAVQRVLIPHVRRYGRPIAAGGKERYPLLLRWYDADVRFEARVTSALWSAPWPSSPPAKPKLAIDGPKAVDSVNHQGVKVKAMRVELRNPEAFDVDVLFRATCNSPRNGETLLGVRLRAGEVRNWIVSQLPALNPYTPEETIEGLEVSKLELVDWCYVAPADAQADERRFRELYADWMRWDAPLPQLAGRFEYAATERRFEANGKEMPFEVIGGGTFELDTSGAARLQVDAPTRGKAADLEREAREAFGEMLADVLRPSADELLARTRARSLGVDVFELDGPGWWKGQGTGWSGSTSGADGEFLPNFSFRDGRLCASGDRERLDNYAWRTRELASGWVVTQRTMADGNSKSEFDYVEFEPGLALPVAFRSQRGAGGVVFERKLLRVFDVRRSAAPAPAPTADAAPTGEGVETLRAAWDFGWRYPTQPRRLRARIEAQTPATDDVWLGRKQVRGELELAGYTGFRPWERSWSSYRFELEGALSDIERLALGMVLDDRLRLWAGRDFNGRASFERAFANATIGAPDAKGRIAIEGSRLASVLVRDGRVVEIERRTGGPLELTWKKLGEDWLVVRTQQGSERLDVNFARAGNEWVPAALRFERVFGDGWGPEEVKLGNLRVE